ncbi:hypothetical protein [Streptomyces roseoviridis]|uniref:Transposase n=1 Tax=Streptomyces roseoviridis TaxID=67361 RepID=A0ABV5QV35_9ACTN
MDRRPGSRHRVDLIANLIRLDGTWQQLQPDLRAASPLNPAP